jgi:hypothetical protein
MSNLGRAPSKVAKGSGANTRTITWGHKKSYRERFHVHIDEVYNLSTFKMSRDRQFRIFSTIKEPFISFEMIKDKLETLPESTDHIFNDYDILICIYHTKDKKDKLRFDGKMQSHGMYLPGKTLRLKSKVNTRCMIITDASFESNKDSKFWVDKSISNTIIGKWDLKVITTFFGKPVNDKGAWMFTYNINSHRQYIIEFLLMHELGHMYTVDYENNTFGKQHRILNYNYTKDEASANKFVMNHSPILEHIFVDGMKEIFNP